jgi:hypothetical protein
MLTWSAARKYALSFPETEELDHFGSLSFRVKGKIFAQLSAQDANKARILLKLSLQDQTALFIMDPITFSSAEHWGKHGWTYIDLSTVDKQVLLDLLRKSWRAIAPKSLVKKETESGS